MSSRCADCGQPITFARNAKGFRVPYDPDGTSHKQTCKGKTVHHKSKRVAQDAVRRARVKR